MILRELLRKEELEETKVFHKPLLPFNFLARKVPLIHIRNER